MSITLILFPSKKIKKEHLFLFLLNKELMFGYNNIINKGEERFVWMGFLSGQSRKIYH